MNSCTADPEGLEHLVNGIKRVALRRIPTESAGCRCRPTTGNVSSGRHYPLASTSIPRCSMLCTIVMHRKEEYSSDFCLFWKSHALVELTISVPCRYSHSLSWLKAGFPPPATRRSLWQISHSASSPRKAIRSLGRRLLLATMFWIFRPSQPAMVSLAYHPSLNTWQSSNSQH